MKIAWEDRSEADQSFRVLRHMIVIAATWMAVMVLINTFAGDLDFVLSLLIRVLLLAVGACLALVGLIAAGAWHDHWRNALLMAAAMPAAYLLSGPLTDAALHLEFLVNKPRYDRLVAELEAHPEMAGDAWRRENGGEVRIDDGPPRRIAFVTWEGIPDPWGAIVHDPSHALASVEKSPLMLFNSSVVKCTALRGAYYRCRFS